MIYVYLIVNGFLKYIVTNAEQELFCAPFSYALQDNLYIQTVPHKYRISPLFFSYSHEPYLDDDRFRAYHKTVFHIPHT